MGRRGSSRAHGGGSSDRRGEEPEGLWDEASKGQLDALAAALAPGGNGNVHATTMGGEREREIESERIGEGDSKYSVLENLQKS